MTTQSKAERLLFLPGASGVASFCQPVIDRLSLTVEHRAFDYPGFGDNPPDPKLASLDDLTDWIETYVDRPVAILAQSMGGVMATQLALRKHHLVRHLVLTGTSGGVPMTRFNVEEWRESYRRDAPNNPDWFTDDSTDLSARVANLPDALLVTVDTDSHFFVRDMPDEVAPHIKAFLGV